MNISDVKDDSDQYQIRTAVVTDAELVIYLKDGRHLAMPLWWSPRLYNATGEQRDQWRIIGFGDALGWEDIDEHLSVKGIMLGGPFPGAIAPAKSFSDKTNYQGARV